MHKLKSKLKILILCLIFMILLSNICFSSLIIKHDKKTSKSKLKTSANILKEVKSNKDNTINTIKNTLKESNNLLQINSNIKPSDKCIIENFHYPWGNKEYPSMRRLAITTLIVVFVIILFIKLIISLIRHSFPKFITSSFKSLIEESFLLIVFISFLSICYLIKGFDDIQLNWQYTIAGLVSFTFFWFVYFSLIILITYSVVFKWFELEKNSKSFKYVKGKHDKIKKKLIEEKYLNELNSYNKSKNSNNKKSLGDSKKSNASNININYFYELYEFIILRIYFTIPFYPLFKPSTLRSDFSLAKYFSYCIIHNLKNIFDISWTCYIITFSIITLWVSFIAPINTKYQLIIMNCYPFLGISILLFLYIYMRVIYRRIVPKINDVNYEGLKDLDKYHQQNAIEKFVDNYPLYLKKFSDDSENIKNISTSIFHRLVHGRPSSFYEETIIFGASSYNFIINTIQTINVVFILWITVMSMKIIPLYHEESYKKNSEFILSLYIISYVCIFTYLLIQSFITAILLRWFTVIGSTEMRRNSECLVKTIKEQSLISSENSEKLFKSFKRLFFDMKFKPNINNKTDFNETFNNTTFIENEKENKLVQKSSSSSNKFNNLKNPVLKRFLYTIVLKYKQINPIAIKKILDTLNSKERINIKEVDLDECQYINKNNIKNKLDTSDNENHLDLSNDKSEEELIFNHLDNIKINVNEELKSFLKTSGNNLTNEDVDFMIHMIEDFDSFNSTNEISLLQLQEVWAVMINFSTLKPEDIVDFVFSRYYEERPELENNNSINEESILEFFRWYQAYFSQDLFDYIEKEAQFCINKDMSLEGFITNILTMRKYYPS